ncbi:hypothetical protein [Nonomuraea rhodomycinica]|uniref:Uncharacterized protein n=1 Tax=Nonomuraea rhodomycinica TaxID=1712872 RepID=A0A7Y6MEH0_9ACTN|nr:hypothetical protein [Nonomuraea rhodomycinica]NUW45558.1 hypothetical protein [Nonomuraea rhodomycinica]
MATKIPSVSVEYLKVPITGPSDVTLYTVQMAVIPDGQDPVTLDWKAAIWLGTNAAVLIGPGATIPLSEGTYRVWVKISASPETPVLDAGLINIT